MTMMMMMMVVVVVVNASANADANANADASAGDGVGVGVGDDADNNGVMNMYDYVSWYQISFAYSHRFEHSAYLYLSIFVENGTAKLDSAIRVCFGAYHIVSH